MNLNRFKYAFVLGLILMSSGVYAQKTDENNGPVKFYYPNGQLSSEGLMVNGRPDGYWKTYYVSGVIKSQGKRFNTLLDSIWNFYDISGNLVQTISYKLGKRNGYTEIFRYDNPNMPGQKTLSEKQLYINDVKEGTSYIYYNTGQLKEENFYREGKKVGLSREFDRDGTVITLMEYKDNYMVSREKINRRDAYGRKQGTFKYFDKDNQLLREETYSDDVLNGVCRDYDDEGNLLLAVWYDKGKIMSEFEEEANEEIDFTNKFDSKGRLIFSGGYLDNEPIGIHRYYDTTGVVTKSLIYNEAGKKISEGIIDDEGNVNGPWKDFYDSGELRAIGSYKSNQKSGDWKYLFKNGNTEQMGAYLRDRFEGNWVWYHPDGSVWRDENYFLGKEDGDFVEYDQQGNVLTKGKYLDGEKEGEWFYNVGDHVEKGSYITGLKEGKWFYYYEDGTLQFEGNYYQGNPDGKQKYFYPSGEIKEEQFYKMGIRTKIWKKYNEDGELKMTIAYRNNEEYRINGVRVNLPDIDMKLIR